MSLSLEVLGRGLAGAVVCMAVSFLSALAGDGDRFSVVSVQCPGKAAVLEQRLEFGLNSAGECRERLVAVVDSSRQSVGILDAENSAVVGTILEKPGWPRTFADFSGGSLTLADLGDQRGLTTVVDMEDDTIHALAPDGQTLPGWPVLFPAVTLGIATIAAVDLLGDLRDELLIAVGQIHVLSSEGDLLPGWPFTGGGASIPIGVRFESGGPVRVVGVGGRPPRPVTTAGAFVLDEQGALLPGWPAVIPKGRFSRPLAQGPAVGDVTGDGVAEVVLTTFNESQVWAFDHLGRTLESFPVTLGIQMDDPSLGDLDGDGKQEIVLWMGTSSIKPAVLVLNGDGTVRSGWPQVTNAIGNFGPAIGDVDGDGLPEVAVSTLGGAGTGVLGGGVYVWRHDGTSLPGWPKLIDFTGFGNSPTIADVDGDGQADVIAVGITSFLPVDGVIYAWKGSGELIAGFPIIIPFRPISLASSAVVADIDRDGTADLGVTSEPGVFASKPARIHWFDLGVPYRPEGMEWPTLAHDMARTGSYKPPVRRLGMEMTISPPVVNAAHPAPPLTAVFTPSAEDEAVPTLFRLVKVDGVMVDEIEGVPVGQGIGRSARAARLVFRFDGEAVRARLGAPGPHRLLFRSDVIGGVGGIQFEAEAEVRLLDSGRP